MNVEEAFRHQPGEIRKITSASNEAIKALRALHLKKHRAASGLFIAEGARTLIEALETGQDPLCIAYLESAREEDAVARIRAAVLAKGGLSLEVNTGVLDKISARENPQTIIGLFRQNWLPLSQVNKNAPRLLALEEVRDPGNLGTILRTCDGFGLQNIILIGECTDPFGLEAVRASMGSLFAVRVTRAAPAEFTAWLSDYRGMIIGTALENSVLIETVDFKGQHLLVMGNEQKGLSSSLKACCTDLVKIPMRGRADSFNLAVATGIALYCSVSAS